MLIYVPLQAAEKYTCDVECQAKTDEFLTLLKKKGEPVPPPQKLTKPEPTSFQPLTAAQQNFIYWIGHAQNSNGVNVVDTQPMANMNPNFNQQQVANPNFPMLNPNINPNPVIWNPAGQQQNQRKKRQQIGAMSLGHNEKMGANIESLGITVYSG